MSGLVTSRCEDSAEESEEARASPAGRLMSAIQTNAPARTSSLDGGFADAAGAASDEGVAVVEAEGSWAFSGVHVAMLRKTRMLLL